MKKLLAITEMVHKTKNKLKVGQKMAVLSINDSQAKELYLLQIWLVKVL
jgi:hypothetical protein